MWVRNFRKFHIAVHLGVSQVDKIRNKARRGVTDQARESHVQCSERLKLNHAGQEILNSDRQGPLPSPLKL